MSAATTSCSAAAWAQYLVDNGLVKYGDFVWMPVEVPGATYGVQEEEGIASVFEPLGITWEVTDATLDQAEIITRMSDYLTANRDRVKAIIGLGDLVTGSIKRVFDQVGVAPGEIPVVGWGNSLDTTQEVLEGYVNAGAMAGPAGDELCRPVARRDGGERHSARLQRHHRRALREGHGAGLRRHPVGELGRRRASAPSPLWGGCVRRGARRTRAGRSCRHLYIDQPPPGFAGHASALQGGTASPPHKVGAGMRLIIRRLIARPEFGPFVLLVIELVVFTAINPSFLSIQNISNTLAFTVELGLIALAMTLLMTSGEFDLSVGSVFGFSPVLMWTLFNTGVTSLEVAFLLAIVTALLIGLVNGLFVTKLKIPSFLVTLGMLLVVRGTALYITDGFPQRTWSAEGQWLAQVLVGDFYVGPFRIYMSLFWFAGAAIILGYILTQTKAGNWIQASGGNPQAARARGVNVNRTKILLFMLSAAMAALAGVISSIRTSAANPNSGTGYELEVIAMVVIGGTALIGGRGTIIGTVIGIFILRVMRNGIVLIGVPGLAYNIFIGAIILGMMALHSWLERRHQTGT